jgi:hypothetical protein
VLSILPGNHKPDFPRADAALAAHDAAAAACFARQNEVKGVISSTAQAYQHAYGAKADVILYAALDLRKLLTLDVGRHFDLGHPIDPGENGPLGSLWDR